MNWHMIWSVVHGLLAGLNDVSRWKVSADGAATGPIHDVRIRAEGARFELDCDGKAVTIEALPGTQEYAVVKVNGKVDYDARLVFSLRHTLTKPLIVVFEFRDVTVDGVTKRYRFDNPR